MLKFFLVLVAISGIPFSANAAIPANVQALLDSLSSDVVVVAVAVLAAIVAVYAVKFIARGIGGRESAQYWRDREGFYDFDDSPPRR